MDYFSEQVEIFGAGGFIPEDLVTSRPEDYNPDDMFDWEIGDWTYDLDLLVAGGGRYQNKLIAVGDGGTIYITEI